MATVALVAALAAAACSSDSSESEGLTTTALPLATAPPATAPTSGPASTEPGSTPPVGTDDDDDPTNSGASTTAGAPSSTIPVPTYDFSAVSPIVQAVVEANGLNGAGLIIVDRDHGVIHEDYWGEFDADRISLVASSSKMITAGVLLHLADEGLLDMDAPVADVAGWGTDNPTITPAQLVSNSSGLLGLIDGLNAGPYACQYLVDGTMQACAEQIFATPDDDSLVIPPDTQFRYGGAQWQIAGAVAEVASGRSWAELIDEIYVQPCDLETLAYNNQWAQRDIGASGFDYPTGFDGDPSRLLPTDNPNMEGGAYLTTGDYAKLLLMHLRGGMCGDTQVLSRAALDQAHADRTGETYGSTTGYGMGWWVDRVSGRIFDPGAYGAVPWLDLEDGYGAYLVIESDTGIGTALAAQLYDVVDTAVNSAI